jgi:hypothetical protein
LDGTDILRNIEVLKFADGVINVRTPAPPTNVVAVATAGANATGSATLTWTPSAPNGSPAVTSQDIVVTPVGGTPLPASAAPTGLGPNRNTATVTGLTNGTAYTFQVRANNIVGSTLSDPSNAVTPKGPPAAITAVPTATRGPGSGQATLSWALPPSDGGSPITGYEVEVRNVTGTTVVIEGTRTFASTARTQVIGGLTNGQQYRFRVRALNEFGPPLPLAQGWSPASVSNTGANAVVPATVPNPPVIGTATPGPAGAPLTAGVTWTAPAFNGGQALTGYSVRAFAVAADGTVAPTPTVTVTVGANATSSGQITLPAGNYRFDVRAINGTAAPLGTSAPSALSNLVAAT